MLRVDNELIDRVAMMAGVTLHLWNLPRRQVVSEINRYKLDFLYLTGFYGGDPVTAFKDVHDAVQGGYPRGFSIPDPPYTAYDRLADFYGLAKLDPGRGLSFKTKVRTWVLPSWFRSELDVYLTYPERHTDDFDFAFWVMGKLFTDGWFMNAVSRMRVRWGISPDTDAIAWYRGMNEKHALALEFCKRHSYVPYDNPFRFIDRNLRQEVSSHEVILDDAGNTIDRYGADFPERRPGEIRFLRPLDDRKLETYNEPERLSYGLPIFDYEADLGTLAWLAGGTTNHPIWRVWIELLLWDFEGKVYSGWDGGQDRKSRDWHWKRSGIRMSSFGYKPNPDKPGWWENYGRMTTIPDCYRTMKGSTWLEMVWDRPGVEFLSRWVNLDDFPAPLRTFLIFSTISTWGKYEPVPSKHRMRAWLQKLLRPLDRTEVPDIAAFDPDDPAAVDSRERALAAARKRRSRL